MGRETELIKAAKTGDLRTLERLLNPPKRSSVIGNIKKSIHPNIQDELGYTLLHHATLNGHRETVSFLIRSGASTTIPDSSGSFPLHLASWKGDIEIVKLLTTLGPSRANVDQQSNSEDTALHLASQYGYCGVVEFLLERHANPMMKNIRGETPLDLASQFGHIDTVHVLISHCPEILRFSRPEMSALHLAARNGHSVVVLSLINAGIPVNTVCKSGSALHEAALCGKENTVKLLLDKGIDIDLKDEEGRTVMHLLADFNNEKYISIKNLVEKYQSGEATPTGRYMKPMRQKLLAIPRRDSKPSQTVSAATDQPQLTYNKDEAIVVCGRVSAKVYIGKVRGITGAFPLKETRLYQDIDGKLNRVYPKDIMESEDGTYTMSYCPHCYHSNATGSLHVLQQPAMNLEQSQVINNSPVPPVNSTAQSKGRSSSLSTLPGTQEEKKRRSKLTDKEKRFILSNDKGDYSQLAPVQAPSTSNAEVRKLTMSPTKEDGEKDFIGSYYLLEVGNFDEEGGEGGGERNDIPPPPPHSPPHLTSEHKLDVASSKPPHYENVKLRSLSSVAELEKPRSTSDGPLLKPSRDVPHKRSNSFQAPYENVTKFKDPASSSTPFSHLSDAHKSSGRRSKDDGATPTYPDDTMSRRAPMPLPTPTPITKYDDVAMGMVSHAHFKIAKEQEDEDVMVSSMNPNYSKVSFQHATSGGGGAGGGARREYEEINLRTVRGAEGGGRGERRGGDNNGLWIIPRDSNPFAGLVESGSVVEGLSDELLDETFNEIQPLTRHRLKSVWDDRRVNQEWNEIDHVLKDMTTDIESVPVETTPTSQAAPPNQSPTEERSNVFLWLSTLGLQGYTNTFETNGFDDVKFMGGGLLDIEDLKQMGIYENDQGTIMIKVAILPPPPRLMKADSVEEWLDALKLSHLSSHFEGYSLQKISTFWEIQISTVLGIELLGHKKRLLYGISELKRIHPQWTLSVSPASSSPILNKHSGPMSDVNFARDYTKIHSLKPSHPPPSHPPPSHPPPSHPPSSHPPPSSRDSDQLELFTDHAPIQWTSSKLQSTAASSGDAPSGHTPSEAPVRGNEYATVSHTGHGDHTSTDDTSADHTPSDPAPSESPTNEAVSLPPPEAKNYRTLYLGSALVKGITGKHSAEEACLKLRMQTDSIAKIPQIILSISWKGVKFVNADTKIVVSTHLIRDISHCCPDIEDPRVFAYMTKDKETDCSYCHVFMVESKEVADEIILSVGQAFEVAYQAVVRARSKYRAASNSGLPKKTSKTSAIKRSFRKLSKKSSSQDTDIS